MYGSQILKKSIARMHAIQNTIAEQNRIYYLTLLLKASKNIPTTILIAIGAMIQEVKIYAWYASKWIFSLIISYTNRKKYMVEPP